MLSIIQRLRMLIGSLLAVLGASTIVVNMCVCAGALMWGSGVILRLATQ